MAGVNATVVRHDELLAVVGFRVLALIGVVMIGIFVPRLARSYGQDASVAFVLAVLNPLVLLPPGSRLTQRRADARVPACRALVRT